MEKVSREQSRPTPKRDLLRAGGQPDRAADRQDLREEPEGRRHPRAAVREDADASRAWRTTSSTPTTRRRWRRKRSSPRASTRRSRPPFRTRCTCRRTPSRASARGRNRSTRTGVGGRGPQEQRRAARNCTRSTTRPTRTCRSRRTGGRRRAVARSRGGEAAARGDAVAPASFAIAAIPARYALERGNWADAAALTPRSGEHALHRGDYALRARARRGPQRQPGRGAPPTSSAWRRCGTRPRSSRTRTGPSRSTFSAASRWRGRPSRGQQGRRPRAVGARPRTPRTRPTSRRYRPDRWRRRASSRIHAARCGQGRRGARRLRGHDEEGAESVPRHLHGAARAAETLGDRAKATAYYKALLDVAKAADTQRPELVQAKKYVGLD